MADTSRELVHNGIRAPLCEQLELPFILVVTGRIGVAVVSAGNPQPQSTYAPAPVQYQMVRFLL